MLNLKRLLRFTPVEAILMMANQSLNTQLRPEIATVGEPISLGGKRAKVAIYSSTVQNGMIQNPYSGVSVLEYTRYDLSDIFDQILLDLKPPTTVQSVVDAMAFHTGIAFDSNDFINERIDSGVYTLRAAPGSKRWVGVVNVTLDAESIGVDISQWLTNNYHEGLIVEGIDYIWDRFPNDILDGLEVGKPSIAVYLRNQDHSGLVKTHLPDISSVLTTAVHDGLIVSPFVDINVYLTNTVHEGLVVDSVVSLADVFPNDVHVGLVLPPSDTSDTPPAFIDGYTL